MGNQRINYREWFLEAEAAATIAAGRDVVPFGRFAMGFGDSPSRIKAEGQNVPAALRVGPTTQVEFRAHVPSTISEAMPTRV